MQCKMFAFAFRGSSPPSGGGALCNVLLLSKTLIFSHKITDITTDDGSIWHRHLWHRSWQRRMTYHFVVMTSHSFCCFFYYMQYTHKTVHKLFLSLISLFVYSAGRIRSGPKGQQVERINLLLAFLTEEQVTRAVEKSIHLQRSHTHRLSGQGHCFLFQSVELSDL